MFLSSKIASTNTNTVILFQLVFVYVYKWQNNNSVYNFFFPKKFFMFYRNKWQIV